MPTPHRAAITLIDGGAVGEAMAQFPAKAGRRADG